MFTMVRKRVLIATALTIWAVSPSAAQDTSPVLNSLPTEAQKHIEEVRNACREWRKDRDLDLSEPVSPSDVKPWILQVVPKVSSGDVGLILFTVSGAQAVMVDDQALCGGQCLKGATCTNVGSYDLNIYVRTGKSWSNALSTK